MALCVLFAEFLQQSGMDTLHSLLKNLLHIFNVN